MKNYSTYKNKRIYYENEKYIVDGQMFSTLPEAMEYINNIKE